jgi:hypothetical protein
MSLTELTEMCDYVKGDFVVCPVVTQAVTLRWFEKVGRYLRFDDEENTPGKKRTK